VTTRGFKEAEMKILAGWIDRTVRNVESGKELAEIRAEVLELCGKFPLYAGY